MNYQIYTNTQRCRNSQSYVHVHVHIHVHVHTDILIYAHIYTLTYQHTPKQAHPYTVTSIYSNRKRLSYEYNCKLSLVNPQYCHQVVSIKGWNCHLINHTKVEYIVLYVSKFLKAFETGYDYTAKGGVWSNKECN